MADVHCQSIAQYAFMLEAVGLTVLRYVVKLDLLKQQYIVD